MPDMAPPVLPRVTYFMRHLENNTPPHHQCVHFVTFGLNHGPIKINPPPILHLNLSSYEPPKQSLCEKYNGLDDEISKNFFSIPANEEVFHRTWETLARRMSREPRGKCVVVLINCMAGMHRSVAMAERLAEWVALREGFKAECLHLDLAKGADVVDTIRVKRVTERSESSPTRGYKRLRREVYTTSGARVRDDKPRAAADAGARPRRGSKTVSFGTLTPVRDPRPQQRDTFGRSAGTSKRYGDERSRLSP